MTPEQIEAVLRARVSPGIAVESVVRGAVGNGQETWFVDAREGEQVRPLVVRRSAEGGTLDWTDRASEAAVLAALASRGLPVPAVYAVGDADDGLERPFMVVDRMPGVAPRKLGDDERRNVGRSLGRWLARIHSFDAAELGFGRDENAVALVREEVARWRQRYYERRTAPVPLLGALLAWLEESVPVDDARPTLLWGDGGPHNILVEDGEITALLDWELSHVGHPIDDLGAALWACVVIPGLDPADVLAGYEDEAGPVDRRTLDYFLTLAAVDRAVMTENGIYAFETGDSREPRLAALGLDLVALNLQLATGWAGWGALPPADGLAPGRPLPPSPEQTLTGLSEYLREIVAPSVADGRIRGSVKSAATLLEVTARRIAPRPRAGEPAAEEAAVAAERAGDTSLRGALLADLARQRAELAPLSRFHGHPVFPPGEPS